MASLLIVGGTGFVGRAIVEAALARGHHITLLNRGSQPLPGTAQLIADRDRPETVAAALAGTSFDAVLDTNAYLGAQARALIDALGGRTPIAIVISSAAVYADDAQQPPGEGQPIGGASVWGSYGADKSDVERSYAQSGAFRYCALLRPPYILGPGNSGDRETWFWTRQLAGRPVLLPGDGQTPVQFVHRDDLAEAILLLAESGRTGTECFNVADPETVSLSDLATLLGEVSASKSRQIAVGAAADGMMARSWFPFRDYPCLTPPDRLQAAIGWQPGGPLRQRFAETLASYSKEDLKAAYRPSETELILLDKLGL